MNKRALRVPFFVFSERRSISWHGSVKLSLGVLAICVMSLAKLINELNAQQKKQQRLRLKTVWFWLERVVARRKLLLLAQLI